MFTYHDFPSFPETAHWGSFPLLPEALVHLFKIFIDPANFAEIKNLQISIFAFLMILIGQFRKEDTPHYWTRGGLHHFKFCAFTVETSTFELIIETPFIVTGNK